MNKQDIDKAYVSPYDRFLFEFDVNHEKSASQLQEIKKYQRIFALRDEPISPISDDDSWDKF